MGRMDQMEIDRVFDPDHREDLQKSGLTEETVARAGIFSVSSSDIPGLLGFSPCGVKSALVFPYSQNGFSRLKLFPPYLDEQGHKVKYLQRKGSGVHLYVPPGTDSKLEDIRTLLFITEGEKKALRAAQDGFCCVGLGGIWNWKETGKEGLIQEIKNLPLLDRSVCLVPDSDFVQNRNVLLAVFGLGKEFEKLGAIVEIACLAGGLNGEKVGLDDFLVSHHREEFHQLKRIDLAHQIFRNNGLGRLRSKASVNPEDAQDSSEITDDPKSIIRARANSTDLKVFDKRRKIAEVVQMGLQKSGAFYRTSDGRCFFFKYDEKRLYEMDQRPFQQMVTVLFGLSSTEDYFRFALDTISSNVARHGDLCEVNTLAVYNTKTDWLIVSDSADGIWVHRDGSWSRGDNGQDGYIFLTEPESQHFEPDFSGEGNALRWFMTKFNFAGDQQKVADQKTILLVWLLSLFFRSILPTKPIPTFLGPQGSGKTTCCRMIGRLFLGPHFNVSGLRDDREDAFIASITNRTFHGIDNADTRVKWLEDALARYSTGETFRMRRLYTTNEEVSYQAKAILMLTSRDPHFRRPDVAERLLPFHLSRLENFQDEESLFLELYKYRPLILGDLLEIAGEVTKVIKSIPQPRLPFRMADFASFGWRIHKSWGKETAWFDILQRLEKSQAEFASEGDVIIETLSQVISSGFDGPISTGELYQECRTVAEKSDLPFPRTPQAFGKRFWELQRMVELELGVKIMKESAHGGKINVSFKKVVESSSPLSPV